MSIISRIHEVTNRVTRALRGESVTVTSRSGQSTNIADAVVMLERISAGDFGSEKATQQGTLRLAVSRRGLLLTCDRATVRGQQWEIVHVGEAHGDVFIVDVRRDDPNYTNLQDLTSGKQIPWKT